ncbi:phosphatase PAP2 family protein [Novosphingobium sp. Leaf2]|uniref:phosphatase PAP2 family protein n=1 Tax=Novosphingobium sp. Leaf2 TaxID=1735670 RepID=UPI0006F42AC7|nr:phosphatase PAP2 family protein [Novosphingobium sp. Leaf2]KQM18785.1 hypothetical protein ASE49_06465 [Novosphingobium sp. Leaf2]
MTECRGAPQRKSNATEAVERTDMTVARATGTQRKTRVVRAMGVASDLADQPPLRAWSALACAIGLLRGDRRLVRTGVRMLASHTLATLGKSSIKHRIDRTRPFVMLDGGDYHAREGDSSETRENSFPSGHTAGAMAVAGAVACEYPQHAMTAYSIAAAAGAIQIPRGKHYLSDVLVGAVIGLAADVAVRLVFPAARDH